MGQDDTKAMRAFPRLDLSCDIQYSYVGGGMPQGDEKANVLSKSKDLSQGGICMMSTTPLVKGTILSLKFKLHSSDKVLNVIGKVVWTQAFSIGNQMGYDNGIEFIKVSDEDKKIIDKFLEKGLTH
jgi:hypothetical protein